MSREHRREDRKRIWIDHFQTRLSFRIAAYLVVFLLVFTNLLFAWRLWQEGLTNPLEQYLSMWRDYLPVVVCLVVLLPALAWDALRFSHRLVGPLVRFRRTIQEVSRGELVRPVKLRDGDYLLDLRDDFNDMLESLQRRGVPVLKPNDPVAEEEKVQRTPA